MAQFRDTTNPVNNEDDDIALDNPGTFYYNYILTQLSLNMAESRNPTTSVDDAGDDMNPRRTPPPPLMPATKTWSQILAT